MRIAIFTDSYLPYTSGVTFAVINQATEMARRGHNVRVFCPRPWARDAANVDQHPDIQVSYVPLSIPVKKVDGLYVSCPSLVTTFRELRDYRPDVVHINTEWGCGWEGLILARCLGIPVIGTFHTFFADPGYLKAIGLPDYRWLRKLMWSYSRFFYDRCDVTTTPSKAVRDALIAKGAKSHPIVVSNGIPQIEKRESRNVSDLKKKYGLNGPTFIYVGRISIEKSLDVLMRAFQNVVQKLPIARFVLVGDGPYQAELTQLIDQLAIRDQVVQLGHVPHQKLIADGIPLLGDSFVTASKTENQPLSLMEAMSFGVPIIGPRSKGIPELIDDGKSGLLFSPDDSQDLADKMIVLANNPDRCRTLGKGAQTKIATHSINHAVDQFEAVYRKVIRRACHATVRDNQVNPLELERHRNVE